MAKQPVLTPQSEDFPRWYQDVVAKAELAETGPVAGTYVIRPWAFALWERIQGELDRRIKAAGADNAYFPLFIPESYLRREAEHVEGFSPELAVVTHGGGKELDEPVVLRPTSETIINSYFSKWVQSYRDLPLLINQWANVVRWEMRPRVFLRTREFLWQEGHTCHVSRDDARSYALRILREVYEDVMLNELAVPVRVGRKTPAERFAGADESWTCEGMMRDGKALQMGTSHELGQNFARVFDTQYLDDAGEQQYVWQTSWGVSTRLIGAVIMAHGDDAGLRLPPRVAPVQVVVLLVKGDDGAGDVAAKLAADLRSSGVRAELDDRLDQSFGRRTVDWELKGVPVRLEVGPRDLAAGTVTVVRRDTGEKSAVPLDGAVDAALSAVDAVHAGLLEEAARLRDDRTVGVATTDEAVEAARTGWAVLPWAAVGEAGEAALADAGVTVRCLQTADGGLPVGVDDDLVAYLARAY